MALNGTDTKRLRQPLTGFLKRPLLVLHREGDDVAALTAGETMTVVLVFASDQRERPDDRG